VRSCCVCAEFREAFELFDANGDGKISRDELTSVMTRLGQMTSDDEITNIMTKADKDRTHVASHPCSHVAPSPSAWGRSGSIIEAPKALRTRQRRSQVLEEGGTRGAGAEPLVGGVRGGVYYSV